ncbi:MAG: ATP-binding protein [Lautropia sp.]
MTGSRDYSLRRRLIATTLGSSIVVGLISTAIVVATAWQEANEAFDDALSEGGRLALSIGSGLAAVGGLEEGRSVDRSHDGATVQYQIIDDDGDVVRRSAGAPRRPFVDEGPRDERFVDTEVDDVRWRVYVARHRDPDFTVQVAQPMQERTELIDDAIEDLVWPLVVLWGLLGLSNWWAVRRLLAPLERLAASIASRVPDDAAPVDTAGQAREVKPLLVAMNALLAKLGRSLASERRFTADAAHELRTPLAAIGSRIQLMHRRVPHGGPLADDLQQLRVDVARTTALVGNLLELARLDPEAAAAMPRQAVDLPALIAEVRAACAAAATSRGIRIDVDCRVETLTAHPEGLFVALRNLLDNAVRHGRPQGLVRIVAQSDRLGDRLGNPRQAEAAIVSVLDDGPGVDPAERERLTDRFHRVLGTEGAGSGLGLSIVARVARLHGAALTFGPGLGGRGFGATLRFPPRG